MGWRIEGVGGGGVVRGGGVGAEVGGGRRWGGGWVVRGGGVGWRGRRWGE